MAAATLLRSKIISSSPRFFFSQTHHLFIARTLPIDQHLIIGKWVGPTTVLAAAANADTGSNIDTLAEKGKTSYSDNLLACPVCYHRLIWNGAPLSVGATFGVILQCQACEKSYMGKESHLELTVSGNKGNGESMPPATELFRSPFVSFLYERGWRQAFKLGGFPGPVKEFEMAKEYLNPVLGGNIVDASCASGMFSRLFAKSGLFSHVIALDYSEKMLEQCFQFILKEHNFPKEKLTLVRADIARLPFVANSIDAVHAGAALHCVPSPSIAIAEITRVLRPGGIFVATTFVSDASVSRFPLLKNIGERIKQKLSGSHSFQSEGELEDLCAACGLVGFTCVRNGLFIMLSATKPR